MLALTSAQQQLYDRLLNGAEMTDELVDTVRMESTVDHLLAYRLKRICDWRNPRRNMERVFVRLRLLMDHGPEDSLGRFRPRDTQMGETPSFDNLDDLLAAGSGHTAFVLLGKPGCGKSTLLRHYEDELHRRALADPEQLAGAEKSGLVLWQSLNRLPAALASKEACDDPENAINDWLAQQWANFYPRMTDLPSLLALHQQGKLPVLFLFDGLNEMPVRESADYLLKIQAWRRWLAWLRDGFPRARVIFTCRSLNYSAPLSHYPHFEVPQVRFEALSDDAIQTFLRKRLPDSWQKLWTHLRDTTRLELERTPFFLDLEVEQFRARNHQPAQGPAELLSGLVWQSLKRELSRDSEGPLGVSSTLISAHDRNRIHANRVWLNKPHHLPEDGPLIPGLIHLAYGMQRDETGGRQVRVELTQAIQHLHAEAENISLGKHQARALMSAGEQLHLLDISLEDESCAFEHQLLQEYFAAHKLKKQVGLSFLAKPWRHDELIPNLAQKIAELGVADPLPPPPANGWEETVLIAAALQEDASVFVKTLSRHDLVLAGRCVLSPEVSVNQTLREEIHQGLLARAEDPIADIRVRIEAALLVGDLGDPRFTRCQNGPVSYRLPPFIPVPAGQHTIGSEEGNDNEKPMHTINLPAFEVARFAVTNAEWRDFINAGAYEDEQWWPTPEARQWRRGEYENTEAIEQMRQLRQQGLADIDQVFATYADWTDNYRENFRAWLTMSEDQFEDWLEKSYRQQEYRAPAFEHDPRFNRPNQPVVGICWFEALAYTRWLSAQTGDEYDLPSEAQWEATARLSRNKRTPTW